MQLYIYSARDRIPSVSKLNQSPSRIALDSIHFDQLLFNEIPLQVETEPTRIKQRPKHSPKASARVPFLAHPSFSERFSNLACRPCLQYAGLVLTFRLRPFGLEHAHQRALTNLLAEAVQVIAAFVPQFKGDYL